MSTTQWVLSGRITKAHLSSHDIIMAIMAAGALMALRQVKKVAWRWSIYRKTVDELANDEVRI